MIRDHRLHSKLLFAFSVAYTFMWALSTLLLIPYYFSAQFDYSLYANFSFTAAISAELNEHYLALPVFFVALAFLFPIVSIFALFSAGIFLKISEAASRYDMSFLMPAGAIAPAKPIQIMQFFFLSILTHISVISASFLP